MPAGQYNFTVEQGATFRKQLIWKDSVGNAVDLTGYTAKMQFKEKIGGMSILELNTTNGGITFPSPTRGQINLYISATDTAAISTTKLVYDLELTSPGGDVIRLVQGKAHLSQEVTT